MGWRARTAIGVAMATTGLVACGGGGGGGPSLLGVSDTPTNGALRADLSRDGTELVYTWDSELRVAAVDGDTGEEPGPYEHSLYETSDVAWYAGTAVPVDVGSNIDTVRWVDDGTIVYTTIDQGSTVHQVTRDGDTVRTIQLPTDARDVAIASGSGHVLWVDPSGGELRLMRRPLDGGDDETLFTYTYDDWFGGYDVSPDGAHLAYVFGSGGGDDSHLFVADADGGNATAIAATEWAPRFLGDEIAFVEDAGLDDDALPLQQVATIPIAGGTATRLTDDRLQKSRVLGQLPDGRFLYAIRSYGYEEVLGLTDAAD